MDDGRQPKLAVLSWLLIECLLVSYEESAPKPPESCWVGATQLHYWVYATGDRRRIFSAADVETSRLQGL